MENPHSSVRDAATTELLARKKESRRACWELRTDEPSWAG